MSDHFWRKRCKDKANCGRRLVEMPSGLIGRSWVKFSEVQSIWMWLIYHLFYFHFQSMLLVRTASCTDIYWSWGPLHDHVAETLLLPLSKPPGVHGWWGERGMFTAISLFCVEDVTEPKGKSTKVRWKGSALSVFLCSLCNEADRVSITEHLLPLHVIGNRSREQTSRMRWVASHRPMGECLNSSVWIEGCASCHVIELVVDLHGRFSRRSWPVLFFPRCIMGEPRHLHFAWFHTKYVCLLGSLDSKVLTAVNIVIINW